MYLVKMNVTEEQLEIMIAAINMEYKYRNDYELAALLSRNFRVNLLNVIDSLESYRAYKAEDFEQLSKKVEYAEL
jgi:hypothetical protein